MLDRVGIDRVTDKSSPETIALIEPSHDEVRAALERIVTSAEFRTSPHLAAFLKFSVETSLAGEGQNIKAYSVATSVLGRPPTFDPQADPIVRVEATRLRRAMERYYLHDGADDPVFIDIPRGRYIAYFSYRTNLTKTASSAASDYRNVGTGFDATPVPKLLRIAPLASPLVSAWRNMNRGERRSVTVFACALIGAVLTWTYVPLLNEARNPVETALSLQSAGAGATGSIEAPTTHSMTLAGPARQRAIFATLQLTPFDSYSDQPELHDISHRITHLIAERAPDLDGIPVLDPDGPMAADPAEDHLYALMGTILQDSLNPDKIEISVRLVQRPSYEIIWTRSYQIDTGLSLFDSKLVAIRNDIIESIGGVNGAIRVDDARRHLDEKISTTPFRLCLAASDLALRTREPERVAKAISCLTKITDAMPNEALIFKQLAALRMYDPQNALERAASASSARRDLEMAIALDPADHMTRQQLVRLRADGPVTHHP